MIFLEDFITKPSFLRCFVVVSHPDCSKNADQGGFWVKAVLFYLSELMKGLFDVVCCVSDCWRCLLSHRDSASKRCVLVAFGELPRRRVPFVFLCENVCVELCDCPPLHVDLQRRVCVSVPSRRMSISHSSMTHLLPQPEATGGHLSGFNLPSSCGSFFIFFKFYFSVVCLWPSSPTPGCPIFLIATFRHSNSAQRWVTPLCQLGNLHASASLQAQINKSEGCGSLCPPSMLKTEVVISIALLPGFKTTLFLFNVC